MIVAVKPEHPASSAHKRYKDLMENLNPISRIIIGSRLAQEDNHNLNLIPSFAGLAESRDEEFIDNEPVFRTDVDSHGRTVHEALHSCIYEPGKTLSTLISEDIEQAATKSAVQDQDTITDFFALLKFLDDLIELRHELSSKQIAKFPIKLQKDVLVDRRTKFGGSIAEICAFIAAINNKLSDSAKDFIEKLIIDNKAELDNIWQFYKTKPDWLEKSLRESLGLKHNQDGSVRELPLVKTHIGKKTIKKMTLADRNVLFVRRDPNRQEKIYVHLSDQIIYYILIGYDEKKQGYIAEGKKQNFVIPEHWLPSDLRANANGVVSRHATSRLSGQP